MRHDIFMLCGWKQHLSYLLIRTPWAKAVNAIGTVRTVGATSRGVHRGVWWALWPLNGISAEPYYVTGGVEPVHIGRKWVWSEPFYAAGCMKRALLSGCMCKATPTGIICFFFVSHVPFRCLFPTGSGNRYCWRWFRRSGEVYQTFLVVCNHYNFCQHIPFNENLLKIWISAILSWQQYNNILCYNVWGQPYWKVRCLMRALLGGRGCKASPNVSSTVIATP